MDHIESLPLHDALVGGFRLGWREAKLEVDLLAFVQKGESAQQYKLRFTDVSNFEAPHRCPWGRSAYVNKVEETDVGCRIEMQSGDEIIIEASSFEFTPSGL